MIDGPSIRSTFGLAFSTAACSNGMLNAKSASPVCITAERVLLSTTGFQVMVSIFG
ncbi:hypothetical protein D3C81_1493790 [compost metagenome]